METINNTDQSRYELQLGDYMAIIDYKIGKSGNIYLVHTEVPKELEGRGVGRKLVEEALTLLAEARERIIPSCPFVKKYMIDHPGKYDHLLVEGITLR